MSRRATVGLAAASAALVAVTSWRLGSELWRFATASSALPQWDMAQNGVAGVRLADALRSFDLFGLVLEIHRQSTWPPTWPLAESAAFLLLGPDIAVARGLVAATWMLTVVAAWWALRPMGDAAALLSAAWVAQAPLGQALATVNLLEVPGALVLMVALGSALRAVTDDRGRWWRATWAASLLLFFLKYNYGLLWLLPLLVAELRRRTGRWRRFGQTVWVRLRATPWRRPWTLFVTVILAGLLAIRLGGGFDAEVLGVRLRVTSWGNPVYALLLLWSLRQIAHGRVSCLRRAWRRLDARHHGVATWLLAPIAFWMLLPPHVKEFFGFVENRSSNLGLVPSLAFYPRAVLEEYAREPWLGIGVLALAVATLGWLASADPRRRLLVLVTLVGWLALLAHPYKLPRLALQVALLTGMLAAARLVGARWVGKRPGGADRGSRRGLVPTAVWIVAVLCLACVAVLGIDRQTLEVQHRQRTVIPGIEPVVEAAAAVAVDGGVVLGTWNELSPGLLEWQARRTATLDATWRAVTTSDLCRRRDVAAVIRALTRQPCRPVAWIRSELPGWTEENAWLVPVESMLRANGGWRLRASLDGGEGRELIVFDCVEEGL